MRVLGQIEDALRQSLALAADPPAADAAERGERAPLQVLDERLQRLQGSISQAERNAAEADALLGAEAEALTGWLQEAANARGKLAACAERGAGASGRPPDAPAPEDRRASPPRPA
jgi:hypothetical protein